jgi:hypothetical protein
MTPGSVDFHGSGSRGAAPPPAPSQARPLVLPFFNLGFAEEFRLVLLLWPALWLAGVEQMALPLIVGWLFLRYAAGGTGFVVEGTARWALALALWQLVPVFWVNPEMYLVYLRSTATAWAQAGALVLFLTTVRSEAAWWRLVRGVEILAVTVAVGGLVYILGIWRGEFTSFLGGILPPETRDASVFFSELSVRSLGRGIAEGGMVRAVSFAMYPTSLSMVAVLLIPFMTWRFLIHRDPLRLLVVLALLLCLASAQSRIAWGAFLLAALLGGAIQLKWMDRGRRRLIIAPLLVVAGATSALVLALAILRSGAVIAAVTGYFQEFRPGSAYVRLRIYAETLRLLPEHWIAGWGTSVRIQGMPANYSAGTHSSFLAVLFQHGVVGLTLYLGLWFSVWRTIVTEARRARRAEVREFWLAMVVAMAAFNLREVADNWWSDHLVVLLMWTLWGLILTAPRVLMTSLPPLPDPRVAENPREAHGS